MGALTMFLNRDRKLAQYMEARGALIALSIVVIYASVIYFVADVDQSQWLDLFGFYVTVVFIPIFLILIGMIYDLIVFDIRSKGMLRPLKFFTDWLSLKWSQYYFLSVLWPLLCLVIIIVSFNIFKQTILLQKGFLYDDMLVQWDRLIFRVDPGVRMHELVNSPWLTLFMDQVYHAWFFPMLIGVMLVAVYGGAKLRLQYMLTWVSCWILLGSMMAWLVPSAGPCFYDVVVGGQYEFNFLMERLREHDLWLKERTGFEVSALKYQQMLLNMAGAEQVGVGGGISAFPSVHNALSVLFALAAFRANKWLGWLMTLFALLILLGSVYLGWHYAIDGVVAGVCTVVFWYFYGWLVQTQYFVIQDAPSK